MTKTQIGMSAIVGILAVVAFFHWIDLKDQERAEAAAQYEACVKSEYHTTPTAWYAEHGEYPECITK